MRLRDAVQDLARRLSAAGVASPEVDAQALAQRALGLGRTGLITQAGRELSAEERNGLEALAARRLAREPLQHILGEVEWGGLRLRATPAALIPRPETEWLLHLALEVLSGITTPRVLDIGTGTGALALGLKLARPDAAVTASDLSPAALDLARENARSNRLDVAFFQTDLLTGLPGPFDLIVSNPPYLPDADRDLAQPEVRRDPDLALYAGPDGLWVARRLVEQARGALDPRGRLLLELDPRNVRVLAGEMAAAGWQTTVQPDLTGRERFVSAVSPAGGPAAGRRSAR